MMALFTAIEATSPSVCLICHSDYGHIITFIVQLTRIELGGWGRVMLFLLQLRKMYFHVSYSIRSCLIVHWAFSAIMVRVLVMVILTMRLWCSVCQIVGILLFPYFLQHLCGPILVTVFHMRYQIFIMLLQPGIETIFLHQT